MAAVPPADARAVFDVAVPYLTTARRTLPGHERGDSLGQEQMAVQASDILRQLLNGVLAPNRSPKNRIVQLQFVPIAVYQTGFRSDCS